LPPLTGANAVPLPPKQAVFHLFNLRSSAPPWALFLVTQSMAPRPPNPTMIVLETAPCFRSVTDVYLMYITKCTACTQSGVVRVLTGDTPRSIAAFKI
jgi:hypothetical protein